MSPEEQDFSQVRRLLALKRHEQPPPGYFNNFSSQVIGRLQATEAIRSDSWLEKILERLPWLRALNYSFESKPLLAGTFGVAVCALLISGIVFTEKGPETETAPLAVLGGAQVAAPPVEFANSPLLEQPTSVSLVPSAVGVSPAASSSLFNNFTPPTPQPASFTVP